MFNSARTPDRTFCFDADQVAHYETAGWRANYARNWPYMLLLVVRLLRAQFHMNVLQALRAAFYITRASVAWAPLDHDLNVVQANLIKFYTVAQQSSKLPFDPVRVANLECRYWIVHRELSGKPEKTALIQSLAELHAGIFATPVEAMIPSATHRAAAATAVDLITSKHSKDIEADYGRIEEYLRMAYGEINQAVREVESRSASG